MADSSAILMRWNAHVAASDVQDPLGLSLRGTARLGSRLLYCITSVTPRARYFSFLPWCVLDHQRITKAGLREAVVTREQALTLGCVAHHEGKACDGGALVGSKKAIAWHSQGKSAIDLRRSKRFSQNPALAVYQNSLINLGFFNIPERPESDEETEEEDEKELEFDDLTLSDLGKELARLYDSKVGDLKVIKHLRGGSCRVSDLASIGKHGGLCELSSEPSADRALLRDIFFAKKGFTKDSHRYRRQSLLLIMELCRQFAAADWRLDENNFSGAVYFGVVSNDDDKTAISIPAALGDIATRWRMFYFHYYQSVALEGTFSWLLSVLEPRGLAGSTIDALVATLDDKRVNKTLAKLLNASLNKPFGEATPSEFFSAFKVVADGPPQTLGQAFDRLIPAWHAVAENNLDHLIREGDHKTTGVGLALPLILLASTLARYSQWDATAHGHWLAQASNDPYVDLVPPVVLAGLARRFGDWWQCKWKDIAAHVIAKFVIHQHQAMAYEKSWKGDRCLLELDAGRVVAAGSYEYVGLGNPRFRSARQILLDLGLINRKAQDCERLTKEGKAFLESELATELRP
jgi:hypothetical protein